MIIYVDMDGVLADFEKAAKDTIYEYPQSQYGFFRNLEPIDYLEGFLSLADVHDVYILTAPSIKNLMSYTEKADWVLSNLGEEWLNRLIICPDKSLLNGDMLIDDHISGKGQEDFEGALIHFGGIDYPNWNSILEDFT